MKFLKMFFLVMLFLLGSSMAAAGDFDWMRDFNREAENNMSEFRVRLAARFNVGDMQIKTVLSNVEKPSDAFVLFRLGEMSNCPMDRVVEKYKAQKERGWGVFAKSLGIKPGSKDFHALKQGHDLYDGNGGKGKKSKGKGKRSKKGKDRY
ncbi:MAG: hypothetical protein V2J25_01505 [Desulfatiglans sp.]|nr:hypothetical protein [Thermodesulfobacteriota bacterium]MEE4351523.1 hypothetical protein [Desulfatiglans sp.]